MTTITQFDDCYLRMGLVSSVVTVTIALATPYPVDTGRLYPIAAGVLLFITYILVYLIDLAVNDPNAERDT